MENPKSNDQLIDDYLLNLLDKEEATAFENQLSQDSKLQAALDSRNELIEGIEAFNRNALKQRLQKVHQQMQQAPAPAARKLHLFPRLAAAASIAALVFAGYWLLRPSGSPLDHYTTYFKAQDLNFGQRDAADPQVLQLDQLYQNQNYTAALPLFKSLLTEAPKSSPLLLGAGISHLELNQPDQALSYFNTCIGNGDFMYKDHAIWYAALAHLKKGDRQRAIVLLKQLAQKDNADHREEARSLLLDLGK